MANIPSNIGGVFLTAGSSVTGSFSGMMSLGLGSPTAITGSLISGFKFASAVTNTGIIEASGGICTIPPGVMVPLLITSCSLASNSAPLFLFT